MDFYATLLPPGDKSTNASPIPGPLLFTVKIWQRVSWFGVVIVTKKFPEFLI